MKEMIYCAKRFDQPERLTDGEYNGFSFYVLSLGTHPCAYVDVTDTELNGRDYGNIDIECHGGLTYSREYLCTVNKKGWFIGWDYSHYGDFVGYELEMPIDIRTNGKIWTIDEIVAECKRVIDQLIRTPQNDEVRE